MQAVEHNLGIDMQTFGRLKTKLGWIERVDPQKVKAFVYEDRARTMEGKHAKLRTKFDMVCFFVVFLCPSSHTVSSQIVAKDAGMLAMYGLQRVPKESELAELKKLTEELESEKRRRDEERVCGCSSSGSGDGLVFSLEI
jgi:hypothetical protein